METMLSVRGLTVTFPTVNGPFEALSGVDLDVSSGERLAVMGESGCGKSVLGHAILGLLDDFATVEGSVVFEGRELRNIRWDAIRRLLGVSMALIPQSPSMAMDPVLRVGRQIDEMYTNSGRVSKGEAKRRTLARLGEVGFLDAEGIYCAYPHQLSGGMCERALLAMGTALSPRLLIADEPTKGLDPEAKIDILRLLRRESEGKAMILITHDYYAPRICDRVAIMYAGEIVEDGPMEKMLTSPSHPYTIGLWDALPSKKLKNIPGSLTRTTGCGCRFGNRCQLKTESCEERQRLRLIGERHSVRCNHA